MRTERVNIEQVPSQLADLITFASEGGEVIIVQDGKPLARLISATDPAAYNLFRLARLSFQVMRNLSLGMQMVGRNWREAWRDPLVYIRTS